MTTGELLAYDIALHAKEAGPEPPRPHDLESHKRWSAWWLEWYRKPLRRPDRVSGTEN